MSSWIGVVFIIADLLEALAFLLKQLLAVK